MEELVHEEDDCVELAHFLGGELIVLVEEELVLEAALLDAVDGLANGRAEVDAVGISHEAGPEILVLHGLAQQHECLFGVSQKIFLVSEHVAHKPCGH